MLISLLIVVSCTKVKPADTELVKAVGVESNANISKAADISSSLFNAAQLAISDVPYEHERRYGKNIGLAMYATPSFGEPIVNEELGLYINTLTNLIGQHSDRPGIIYHAAVIHSPKKNVYAVPGGFVFITSGLISELSSEAELAFALGHAIAAIAKRHALNHIKKSRSLAQLFEASYQLTDEHAVSDKDYIKAIEEHKNSIMESQPIEETIDADIASVEYIRDVGYDPTVAARVLDIIDIETEKKEQRKQALQPSFDEIYDLESLVTTTGRLPRIKEIITTNNK